MSATRMTPVGATGLGAPGADPADSIYTFVFQADAGDSWGGTLVEDSFAFAIGTVTVTPFGRYTILAEQVFAGDLTPLALEEGMVFVAWYHDADTSQFLATQRGAGSAAGVAGLGSEVDAAWTGAAWDSFGLGGADQAEPVDGPDSLFTWAFVSHAGDTIWGTLHDESAAHAAGDRIGGVAGTYTILTEQELGADTDTPSGEVRMLRYQDGASRQFLALDSAGIAPTGSAGPGSETDRAFDGVRWVEVGRGGALQADRRPDARFGYVFEAAEGGDRWTGWLVDHAPALQPGASLVTPHGRYRILTEEPWSGPAGRAGHVWVTGYLDGETGRSLVPRAWSLFAEPSGTAGLGSERDAVWNGSGWAEMGLGGALLAQVIPGATAPVPGTIWV